MLGKTVAKNELSHAAAIAKAATQIGNEDAGAHADVVVTVPVNQTSQAKDAERDIVPKTPKSSHSRSQSIGPGILSMIKAIEDTVGEDHGRSSLEPDVSTLPVDQFSGVQAADHEVDLKTFEARHPDF